MITLTMMKQTLRSAGLSLLFIGVIVSYSFCSTEGWKLFTAGGEGVYGLNNPVFVYKGYLYCSHFSGYYRVKLNSDGRFSEMTSLRTGLGMGLQQSSVASNGECFYFTGGKTENDIPNLNSFVVYYVKIDSKGFLSSPIQTYDLRNHRAFHSSLVVNNRLYVLGGYSHNEHIPQFALKSVEYADIDTTTGGIKGPFKYTHSFSTISGKVYVAFNRGNRIFCLGERSTAPNQPSIGCWMEYADIQTDGSLGMWTALPGPYSLTPDLACLTDKSTLFIIGPSSGSRGHPSMRMALSSDRDNVSVKLRAETTSLIGRKGPSTIAWDRFVYLLGGDKASYEVYASDNSGSGLFSDMNTSYYSVSESIQIPDDLMEELEGQNDESQ